MEKHVLGLELPTDPRWVNIAEMNIREILVDHAYCEQKAASNAISLIIKYPERKLLVEMLTPLVAEEWSHFARVLDELHKRGLTLGPNRKDEYVDKLQTILRKGGGKDEQLVEKLLLSALIEARSCERFSLLRDHIDDTVLAEFYGGLFESEARHHSTYVQMACQFAPAEVVRARLDELAAAEAEIIAPRDPLPRMHS